MVSLIAVLSSFRDRWTLSCFPGLTDLIHIYGISSENCLIGYDGVLKLGDFGFARSVERERLSQTYCGSTLYAAPEVLTAKYDYDPKYSDIWSCGIVLYVMFAAKMPFGREELCKFLKLRIVKGNIILVPNFP